MSWRAMPNRIPEHAENLFSAVPVTPHGHAINCVPVHRFRMRRPLEIGGTLAEWGEFRATHLRAYSCMT